MFRNLVTMIITFAVLVLSDGMMAAKEIDSGLVGYWKLNGDFADSSGHNNHGRGFGVDLSAAGRSGKPSTAARFNGMDAMIEVADSESLQFGTGDFSIAAWVLLDEDVEDVVGDIVSKFDDEARRGFNFYVNSSASSYNSRGDNDIPVFGIDNAVDGEWLDCGKLWPSNVFVCALTVFDGYLYGGLADALDPIDACRMFRYNGGQEWIDCGRVSPNPRTRSVYSAIVHKGDLYVGGGRKDWRTTNRKECDPVHVYRYRGETTWEDCGQPGENTRIIALASYNGDLYASTDNLHEKMTEKTGKVYKYAGEKKWIDCGRLGDQNNVFAMHVHNGRLYAGTLGEAYVYEGGTKWTYIGTPCHNTQLHSLKVYRGHLYAGTWPAGYVARYEGGMTWADCGTIGLPLGARGGNPVNEVNDLTVYNGKLYGGCLPKGEVWRYEGGRKWTLMKQLVNDPTWDIKDFNTWNRVQSLTEYNGALYAATTTCRGNALEDPHEEEGRVYSYTAGTVTSYDRGLEPGWRHLVAVKDGNMLKLYIDGLLQATSRSFDPKAYDLSTKEWLFIGYGAVDYFTGTMDEVSLYNRALDPANVQDLYQQPPVD